MFEGLPVRQWRQGEGTFGLPPPAVVQQDKDLIFPELKMPRDSHLLAPWTQQLLREARKPRSAKRKVEQTEDVKPEEDEDQKERQHHNGWTAKKWSQISRQLEEPEPEYLAKRRKGLPSSYIEAPAFVPQIATRTAKVRKTDASGQEIVYEVIVPEGQTIEGEVKDEDVSMLEVPTLAPGTVVEGVGVANAEGQVVANDLLQPTPSRRRKPPPPKRKGGPGRGKKKVMFQPTTTTEGQGTSVGTPATTDGATPSGSTTHGNDANGANGEGEDDDGEDGEDGEEGEDGDEGDDDDREDGELSDGEGGVESLAEQVTDSQPAPIATTATDVAMPDAEVPAPAADAPATESTELPGLSTSSIAPPMELIEPTPTPVQPVALSMPAIPPQPQDTLPGLGMEPVAETGLAHEVAEGDVLPQEATTIPGLDAVPPTTSEVEATNSVVEGDGGDVEMSNNAAAEEVTIAHPEEPQAQTEAAHDTAPIVTEPQEPEATAQEPPRPDPLSISAITEPPPPEPSEPAPAPLDVPPVSAAGGDIPLSDVLNDAPPTESIPAVADAPTLPAVVEAEPVPPAAAEPDAPEEERHAMPIADLLAPAAEEEPKEDAAPGVPVVEETEQPPV